MPRISFTKNIPAIDVESGANLMQTLLAHEIPVASSCQGKGSCSKCKIQVLSGKEKLPAETELEKMLKTRNNISEIFRISCQTSVTADITIDTAYW